jgi:hypothetical protein
MMRFPVPREWRPWAYARIMERFGENPNTDGASYTIGTEWGGVQQGQRMSPWRRRQHLLWANFLKDDGTPLHDIPTMFDRMSDKWIGRFPYLFLGGCLVVIVATTVIALHFV